MRMTIDKTTFRHNLHLTQAYCARQLQQAHHTPVAALRSLNPMWKDGQLFRAVPGTNLAAPGEASVPLTEWAPTADAFDPQLFGDIFASQLTAKLAAHIFTLAADYPGKILAVEYDENIPDGGTAAIESKGFVDVIDLPPIDTWFYWHAANGYYTLFAWVPATLVTLANRAVEAHYLDILHWFEEYKPWEYARLMKPAL